MTNWEKWMDYGRISCEAWHFDCNLVSCLV